MLIRSLLLMSALMVQAQTDLTGRSPFSGKGLTGTGRACNGDIRIYPDYLDYSTSYSECNHMPYRTLPSDHDHKWVYELVKPVKRCGIRILVVLAPAKPENGFWRVVMYPSLDTYRKKDLDRTDSCPMY